MLRLRLRLSFLFLATTLSLAILAATASPARAQFSALPDAAAARPTVAAVSQDPIMLSQMGQSGDQDILPLDLTPVELPERGQPFETFQTTTLYNLPARMFFNMNVENTLRLETNVFQTAKRNRADMIYRVLPNITLGYALTKRTRVAANYFFLRDQYTVNNTLLSRNFNSIGFRIDHDVPITEKTTLTTGLFAREIFINRDTGANNQALNDWIPSVVLVRPVGRRAVVYGSVLGQFRWRGVFRAWQEADQFYSFGGIYRKYPYTFRADHTFISNFGKRALRGGPNNQIFVLTYEAARQIHPRLPMAVFVRAEPIFNMGANQAPGFAGVNVRIFGGIRIEMNKPAIFPVKFQHS